MSAFTIPVTSTLSSYVNCRPLSAGTSFSSPTIHHATGCSATHFSTHNVKAFASAFSCCLRAAREGNADSYSLGSTWVNERYAAIASVAMQMDEDIMANSPNVFSLQTKQNI